MKLGTQPHRYQYPGVVSRRLVDHWCLMFTPSLEVISVMSKNEAQRNKLGLIVEKGVQYLYNPKVKGCFYSH